ncbi:MAG: hypothetical protein N3G78_05875 [Desulfobacterota bacterium]|nr:hypothetical protein [Thermodesulfobacteriota bacterium]
MWPIFLKIVSILFLILFVLGVVLMLLTWRKAKFVKPKWILFGQVVAVVALLVFTALSRNPLGFWGWLLIFLVGIGGGYFYGRTVKVKRSEQGIMMNYTLPYVITWAVLLFLTQFLTISTGRVPIVVLGLSVLNTGLNLAMNGQVVRNYVRLKNAVS